MFIFPGRELSDGGEGPEDAAVHPGEGDGQAVRGLQSHGLVNVEQCMYTQTEAVISDVKTC